MGSEEELSCPVFDLLKQGDEEEEEEEEGPIYENLVLNSPALSLPPPLQVNNLSQPSHHNHHSRPVQRRCVGGQLGGGGGGGPQPDLDQPEPCQD